MFLWQYTYNTRCSYCGWMGYQVDNATGKLTRHEYKKWLQEGWDFKHHIATLSPYKQQWLLYWFLPQLSLAGSMRLLRSYLWLGLLWFVGTDGFCKECTGASYDWYLTRSSTANPKILGKLGRLKFLYNLGYQCQEAPLNYNLTYLVVLDFWDPSYEMTWLLNMMSCFIWWKAKIY